MRSLQRRDDRAAIGVVLGVGREGEQHVEGEAYRKAADLEVALFEQVQEADLDARREIGQLVDREDAAVGARNDSEVDDLGVGVGEPAGRRLDRIDVAEQVGDRDVRSRELLAVARLADRAIRSARRRRLRRSGAPPRSRSAPAGRRSARCRRAPESAGRAEW